MSRKEPAPDATAALITVSQAAKRWHRSVASIYEEITSCDYHEEAGIFFRHLARREWRINEDVFLYWRRLPLSASPDVRLREVSSFLLRSIEPTLTALLLLARLLHAEHEASSVRLEQASGTDHEGEKP